MTLFEEGLTLLLSKNTYYLFATVFLIGILSACNVQYKIKKADRKFAIGEYYEAGNIYQSAYKQIKAQDKSTRAYVAFRQGECYRELNNQKATAAYKNAIRYHYADSIVYLHYAQALMYQGKYADAGKNFDIYLAGHPDHYVAQQGRMACDSVATWKKNASRHNVAAEKSFNHKRYSSYAPQFVGDDPDVIMFSSNRTPTSKKGVKNSGITGVPVSMLFTTRKNAAGTWEEIEPAEGIVSEESEGNEQSESGNNEKQEGEGTEVNPAGGNDKSTPDIGVCCFTADGKTMFFTYSKPVIGEDQGAKIMMSTRSGGTWGEPKPLKLFEDSTITCGHPTVTHNADTLYFVSDAPGGQGGNDLWMVENLGDGWGLPENLGPDINTTEDELFPYLRQDGTLYFSSNGHAGFGGLDIFRAERQDSSWSVTNLGAPFNSQNDDFGITFEKGKEDGFFSSNRGQKKGIDNIYRFSLPEMVFIAEGTITDNNGERLSDAILRMVGTDGTNQKLQVKKDGTYRLKLKHGVRYVMLARSRGYLNQKEELTTEQLKDSKTFTIDFALMPISKPVTMDNIFYEFGKWTLTPQSEEGLMQLVKLLGDNPNITIELSAHTDRVGNAEANKTLSEKRAQSVVEFLVMKGIEPERLTPVGYGKEKPVVADNSIHKQYPFIPIEQVLDEEFIDTLPKEQQEICNQINRRTEFKVLKTTYKLY